MKKWKHIVIKIYKKYYNNVSYIKKILIIKNIIYAKHKSKLIV